MVTRGRVGAGWSCCDGGLKVPTVAGAGAAVVDKKVGVRGVDGDEGDDVGMGTGKLSARSCGRRGRVVPRQMGLMECAKAMMPGERMRGMAWR